MPILELLAELSHRIPHSPYIILFALGFIVLIKMLLPPLYSKTAIAFKDAPAATHAERFTGLLLGTAVGDAKVVPSSLLLVSPSIVPGVPFIGMSREVAQTASAATPRGSTTVVYSPLPANHVIRRAEDFPQGSWSDVTGTTLGAARALVTRDLSASAGRERKRAVDEVAAAARLGGVGPALAAVGPVALLFALQQTEPSPSDLQQAVSSVLPDDLRAKVLPYALLHARTLLRLFASSVRWFHGHSFAHVTKSLDVWISKEARARFLEEIAADAVKVSTLPEQLSATLRLFQARVAKDSLTDELVSQSAESVDGVAYPLLSVYGLWALRPPGFTTCVKGALMGGPAPHALAALLAQMLGGVRGQSVIPIHYSNALRTNPAPLYALGEDLAATAQRSARR